MASLCIAAHAPAQTTVASFRPPGDVTGDLRVGVDDAIYALRILANLQNFTTADITALDVAPSPGTGGRLWGDGRLTTADVIRLLRRAAAIEPDPWPGGAALTPSTRELQTTLTSSGSPYRFSTEQGVVVTGKLLDESGNPLQATLYFWNTARRLLGKVVTSAQGAFTLSAPAGVYEFSTLSNVDNTTNGSHLEIATDSILNVTLSPGMAPITVQRGKLPSVFTVQGSINTIPTGYVPDHVEFLDLIRQFEVAPPPTLATATLTADGKFTALLPTGTYKPLVVLARKDKQGTVAELPAASVSVTGNRTGLSLPAPLPGSLSGTFTVAGFTSLITGSVITSALLNSQQGGGSTGVMAKSAYFVSFQPAVNYSVAFLLDALNPTTSPGNQLAWVEPGITVNGNVTRNFTLPAPPAAHAIQFWIGDRDDDQARPIPNARITLSSVTLNGGVENYRENVETTADSQGVVKLSIPDGLYSVRISPSSSLPSVVVVQAVNSANGTGLDAGRSRDKAVNRGGRGGE